MAVFAREWFSQYLSSVTQVAARLLHTARVTYSACLSLQRRQRLLVTQLSVQYFCRSDSGNVVEEVFCEPQIQHPAHA